MKHLTLNIEEIIKSIIYVGYPMLYRCFLIIVCSVAFFACDDPNPQEPRRKRIVYHEYRVNIDSSQNHVQTLIDYNDDYTYNKVEHRLYQGDFDAVEVGNTSSTFDNFLYVNGELSEMSSSDPDSEVKTVKFYRSDQIDRIEYQLNLSEISSVLVDFDYDDQRCTEIIYQKLYKSNEIETLKYDIRYPVDSFPQITFRNYKGESCLITVDINEGMWNKFEAELFDYRLYQNIPLIATYTIKVMPHVMHNLTYRDRGDRYSSSSFVHTEEGLDKGIGTYTNISFDNDGQMSLVDFIDVYKAFGEYR